MLVLLEFMALMVVGLGGLFTFAVWVRRRHPKGGNLVAFLLACGSSYSVSFTVDMLVHAKTGKVPFGNLAGSAVVWTTIAVGLYVASRQAAVKRWPVYLPYLLNAGLAFAGGAGHGYDWVPGVPLVLIGLMASRIQVKPAVRCFPIGDYILDMPVDGLTGLVEFSPGEYATMGRQFEGETNYNAPSVTFLGREWKLQLGTVHGRVYKIAPYLDFMTKQQSAPIVRDVLVYCTAKLGRPSSVKGDFHIWDTSDGNVVAQTAETPAGILLSIFATSNAVRSFKRRAQ